MENKAFNLFNFMLHITNLTRKIKIVETRFISSMRFSCLTCTSKQDSNRNRLSEELLLAQTNIQEILCQNNFLVSILFLKKDFEHNNHMTS